MVYCWRIYSLYYTILYIMARLIEWRVYFEINFLLNNAWVLKQILQKIETVQYLAYGKEKQHKIGLCPFIGIINGTFCLNLFAAQRKPNPKNEIFWILILFILTNTISMIQTDCRRKKSEAGLIEKKKDSISPFIYQPHHYIFRTPC